MPGLLITGVILNLTGENYVPDAMWREERNSMYEKNPINKTNASLWYYSVYVPAT